MLTFRVFWKEKKKGTGGVENQDGQLPIFGSLLRQRMLVPYCDKSWPKAGNSCHDQALHVVTVSHAATNDPVWVDGRVLS